MKITKADQSRSLKDIRVTSILYGNERYPFYIGILLISFALLLFLPSQVTTMEGKNWYLQPAFGPIIGLSVMTLFSFIYVCRILIKSLKIHPKYWIEYLYEGLSETRVPILTCILFYIYIKSIGILGFFLSTLIFICTLLFLTRLINRFWLCMSLIATIIIILIFRVSLGLWMDNVWLYEFFPIPISDFLNKYF